ncbi:LOW QUALITY PROTEIN: teleost multiple tissue opsin 3a [Cyclopterus lumpus]|uniref:LOW QUALITY PROTEIN: teleost multiple tissue opsin 3a n=1 Tax=Cyclopterus lumpus TaxID=8103 RepID=UPI00148714C4|nr:LOW QUALITY PROTEIN: teleost multiple tissue opsin 3a [Cyclopterus lumpus]
MVVHIRAFNFSTADSALASSSLGTVATLRDSPASHSPGGLSRTGHTVVAVCLGFILVAGILNNFLALLIFAKCRSLWTPINVVLLNISVSDILVCVFGTPFSFAASLHGRWLIGERGCKWYGFANSLFGDKVLVSIILNHFPRFLLVLSSQVDISDFRKTWLCVAGSWLYSLLWTMPPFLGWSSYGPEGPGTSCSIQCHLSSATSVSYDSCLYFFILLGTLLLQLHSYSALVHQVKPVGKINLLVAQRREQRILAMVLSMVSCYMLCWMPYGIMALMVTFGRSGLVTPTPSVVPSVLAKFSTVVNPVIYMFFNNQFYRCFVAFIKCSSEPRSVQGEEQPTPRTQFSGFFLVRRQASLSSSQRQILGGSRSAALCTRHNDRHTLVIHYSP